MVALLAVAIAADGQTLSPERLAVVYARGDARSESLARVYASARHVPPGNVVGLDVPDKPILTRGELRALRAVLLDQLSAEVQSLLLVWARPYAAECMSVTTAFAAGFRPEFCEPGCGNTAANPLFDAPSWIPADTVGWLPAMLLPSADERLARAVLERGLEADGSKPRGTVYLVQTSDRARNVRATEYEHARAALGARLRIVELHTPVRERHDDVLAYFTGAARVEELASLSFRPGAVGDTLTSLSGQLEGSRQTTAVDWLRQGVTGSYGTVSEPCNLTAKFPDPAIFLTHYLRGETLLEAYWKSVAMPGQGLFVGEPLARPYAAAP